MDCRLARELSEARQALVAARKSEAAEKARSSQLGSELSELKRRGDQQSEGSASLQHVRIAVCRCTLPLVRMLHSAAMTCPAVQTASCPLHSAVVCRVLQRRCAWHAAPRTCILQRYDALVHDEITVRDKLGRAEAQLAQLYNAKDALFQRVAEQQALIAQLQVPVQLWPVFACALSRLTQASPFCFEFCLRAGAGAGAEQ